ncbi:hypothetical protein ACOSP7_019032 [Xanthoceras sorbifolium]
MSIPNFLSIHFGKFRLSLLGVIKGGIGIRRFDKPRKNKQPPFGFDTQATRPAKHQCPPLSTFIFDLINPTWKQYLPPENPLSPSFFTRLGKLGCPYSQSNWKRERSQLDQSDVGNSWIGLVMNLSGQGKGNRGTDLCC